VSNGSVVPDVLTALVSVFSAASAPGVWVAMGPMYDPPASFLAVGWDRSDQPAVTFTRGSGNAAMSQSRDSISVSCLLSTSYDPNGAVLDVLTGLYAAFDVFAQAITPPNPVFDVQGVMSASIVEGEYTPILTEAGALADLRFTVVVDALK
jgi:hypothetical protein